MTGELCGMHTQYVYLINTNTLLNRLQALCPFNSQDPLSLRVRRVQGTRLDLAHLSSKATEGTKVNQESSVTQ